NQGPDFDALWADVMQADLTPYVQFLGARPNPLDYFAAFDVFALVSREDPFPVVNLEAALVGKPIVCFDGGGGAREFVEDDCGFIVPYLDIENMASKVEELLKSEELRCRLGQRAAQKVRERHDVLIAAPRILNMIRRYI
ncbi:MAG: glycosyltransferase family 4 protein, partial [Armatimonadota bacterium]|nr:glycosyltransferase family 4 protein [Armatimonadota bacterium]